MSLKEKLVRISPYILQNIGVTVFNTYQYKLRHGGDYLEFRDYYKQADSFSKEKLDKEIDKKKNDFLAYVRNNSEWYVNINIDRFQQIPVLKKFDIINHLNEIKTINESEGLVSLTGGTTGASMKVIYTKRDMQERFAILDHFRAQHGYNLGKKTAWFSGKNLISQKDIEKGICSHYDFINKIRFYSTFLINEKNFDAYWQSLCKFQPEFLVGFPSSVFELCQIAKNRGLNYPSKVKIFFPTAETVLAEHRQIISEVLGCKLVNQYASSEGAPFIVECSQGNLHIHPLTGIFEVVDENLNPSLSGQMLVTSFTTHGTPLVRYQIGDSITLADGSKRCACGSIFPIVDSIEGRTNDYILSPTNGKVNLGNLSNSTKDTKGIICFQIIQNSLNSIEVKIVKNNLYDKEQEKNFLNALTERIGGEMEVKIYYVDAIEREKSGKFRLVKNLMGK